MVEHHNMKSLHILEVLVLFTQANDCHNSHSACRHDLWALQS